MELEVFVHGALCIAYSGRCLLSGYFNHRDANQGTCTNACRWEYQVHAGERDTAGDARPKQISLSDTPVHFIEEKERPGELMPIEEDENGTYIMNSKDLRAIEHIHRLVEIGIDSLKIEGRTKSHYYVARTAQVYRAAIDDAVAGRPFDPELLNSLDNLANRGYTDGFYQRHADQDYQNYLSSRSNQVRQQFVGEISGYDPASGLAEVAVKNKFAVGDALELILPQGNRRLRLDSMQDVRGNPVQEAPGGGYRVRIPLAPGDYELGLIARELHGDAA
ncbi:MAG TPA: U32 family peptidase C-terminal domain-containing protein, partial [Thiohalobacter sp.]|nr:U32 family peptidase C-terminal domain-containing protein [Thiohalobacter sp.]